MTRNTFTTLAEIAGAALISAAAFLIVLPLGLAVAGGFLILFGWVAGNESL